MLYEIIKDGKRVYISRELGTVKRIMAKEVLGLSDRQAYDPSFEPEDYKFNKSYKPFRGTSIHIKQISDDSIDNSPVKDEDDTLPWYIIYATNEEGSTEKPVAQSQKKEKIIKKLNSLNVWVDDFELGKVYESESKIFYKVGQQDDKIGQKIQSPAIRTVERTDVDTSRFAQKNFVSRRGQTHSAPKKKNSGLPEVINDAFVKISESKPFAITKLEIEGRTTAPSRSRTVESVLDAHPDVDYWIFHKGIVVFFHTANAWYSIGEVSDAFGNLFKSLVKPTEFSV